MPSVFYQQIDATLEQKIVAKSGEWVVMYLPCGSRWIPVCSRPKFG